MAGQANGHSSGASVDRSTEDLITVLKDQVEYLKAELGKRDEMFDKILPMLPGQADGSPQPRKVGRFKVLKAVLTGRV